MDTSHAKPQSETRKAAVGGLAVVGFVALILIGIATAIYAASYLPKAIGKLSSANVYLSTLVQPNTNTDTNGNQLQPVAPPSNPVNYTDQPATTTIPINVPPTATQQPTTNPTYTPPATNPTTGTPTYQPTQPTYTRVQVPYTPNYYGQADLVTTITSVGYLRNNGDTSSFVSANTVPSGYQGAVRFVIANRGTNISGTWRFRATLPTGDNQSDYRSASQQSLKPGDSVVFTLGFDNTDRGSDSVRVTADSDNTISESNENNNTATASIYFNGTSNGSNSSNTNNSSYDSNGNYCRYGTYYQNNRYYCETSSNSNTNHDQYDSNGNYCRYGTYYQNGRYYCDSSTSNNNNNNGGGDYDYNGNYCSYGTYYYNGRYYCS